MPRLEGVKVFLQNRTIQMKFVKDNKKPTTVSEAMAADVKIVPEYAAELAKDVVTHAALTIGGVFIAYRLVDTACKIAVITAKAIAR